MSIELEQKTEAQNNLADRLTFPPAVEALLIQAFSLCICGVGILFAYLVFAKIISLLFFLVAHALIAACISYRRKMDWWWWIIQFLFPIAAFLLLTLDVPRHYYLAVFVVMALLFWSTFRTQVPYYPSRASLPSLIHDFLPDKSLKFVDLGSGLGGLVLNLSLRRGDSVFWGVEIAPLPWLLSYIRSKFHPANARFFLKNYDNINLGDFDVVFAYLSPAAMPALWNKVASEMRPGSLFLSYEFIVPDVEPDLCINTDSGDPILYIWRI
ncbi:class I SAM-dependent methyltransferase [Undibacterium sp. Jales W-56]|uniref:class I SAM-dependent methyltransferase n=1 Tax=Undibacterium sp. Jales W-56 TaxID=2897325 RepID=UPI0021D1A181|nr:class I SAM-dependent methyltransferase [Undibacterium sp. Jales W-56]MCU6433194.1 class I SAM-dependent methyltransferase [Undibacterium sp. Jales W-56]